ncbi:HDOD domain-containing protein [Alteromonas sp. 5E99-2]|uniref:HDOD domain-containing protein n=1 Tax=Alteromonas sp. 5E99-2 TaxID=2817683 RepID=UPI001A9860EA|nr:HDOD domain-containing protein [Alteromonas sp. 5E99-2]MBO1254931.1 HDOD domain-containing protein [Alteromonas sp. 5E99-2]
MNIEEYAQKAESLFALPDSVVQLKSCMDDDAASIDNVGAIVLTDPGLAAHILKVANSALYNFPNKIDTMSKALQVIGTRAAYDLALSYGVSYAFKDIPGYVIDLDRFWEQSICCGLLAKQIAEFHNHREPERFFVTGLLNNIGELIVASLNEEAAKKNLDFSKDVTPPELQHEVLGFDYASLSGALLKAWCLPESIYAPLQVIHNGSEEELTRDAQIVKLAYYLALDNVNNEIYEAYENITSDMHQRLDLETEDLEEALDKTNIECMGLMSLFSPTSFMLY